ncbi:hypothetical protein MHB44_03740 [Lysinibacillus sp. FSL H8-0500]
MSLDERKQMWQQRIEDYRSSGEPSVKAWCQLNVSVKYYTPS